MFDFTEFCYLLVFFFGTATAGWAWVKNYQAAMMSLYGLLSTLIFTHRLGII